MDQQNDYASLVRLIRDEFDLATTSLREDVRDIKTDLRELKGSTYTREMIDQMFQLRDERISRLQAIGSIIAGIIGTLYCLLYALQVLHVIP